MATILSRSPHVNVTHDTYTTTTIPVCKIRPIFPETYGNLPRLVKNLWKFVLSCKNYLGWVGLSGFLWWAPSAKRKDHHGVSFGWSSVWHRSNTGLSSTQYEQIPIILGVWPFWLTPCFFRSITFGGFMVKLYFLCWNYSLSSGWHIAA